MKTLRVLAPLDGSPLSEAILPFVARLDGPSVTVTLLAVLEEASLFGGGAAPETVQFGATVVLTDLSTDEQVSYRIVGEDEADPKRGLISVTSPVARALMNKRVDDEVIVKAPKGDRELEILEIRFD